MTKATQVNEMLFQQVVSDLPLAFLNELPVIQQQAYHEATEIVLNDGCFDEAEAHYIIPHLRRAKFEQLFRLRALDNGLPAIVQSTRKNASYTLVTAGSIILTASFAHHENEFVRPAHFRDQHSSLNSLLAQMELFESTMKAAETGSLYAIVLHGKKSEGTNQGFLRLAFPSHDRKCYADNYNIYDLITASQDSGIGKEEIDLAVPTTKKKQAVQSA